MSVTLHTTLGNIKIEVFCESVPKTAENFLALCASSAYDSSPFHRSLPTFMVQTGSPASASAKVSTSIWGTDFEDEIRPSLRHNARGIVAMANKGPNTNGSQFYITYGPAPHLDGKNTVFGRVIGDEGTATLQKLETKEVDKKGRMQGGVVSIERVTIHANPIAG
ncbi:cyclophilin-like peptidylprolyl cis trans isomerase [Usnea florida]